MIHGTYTYRAFTPRLAQSSKMYNRPIIYYYYTAVELKIHNILIIYNYISHSLIYMYSNIILYI